MISCHQIISFHYFYTNFIGIAKYQYQALICIIVRRYSCFILFLLLKIAFMSHIINHNNRLASLYTSLFLSTSLSIWIHLLSVPHQIKNRLPRDSNKIKHNLIQWTGGKTERKEPKKRHKKQRSTCSCIQKSYFKKLTRSLIYTEGICIGKKEKIYIYIEGTDFYSALLLQPCRLQKRHLGL